MAQKKIEGVRRRRRKRKRANLNRNGFIPIKLIPPLGELDSEPVLPMDDRLAVGADPLGAQKALQKNKKKEKVLGQYFKYLLFATISVPMFSILNLGHFHCKAWNTIMEAFVSESRKK